MRKPRRHETHRRRPYPATTGLALAQATGGDGRISQIAVGACAVGACAVGAGEERALVDEGDGL